MAFFELSKISKLERGDVYLEKMVFLAENEHKSAGYGKLSYLHSGLGNSLEKLGDYHAAFHQFSIASEYRRSVRGYNEEVVLERLTKNINVFTRDVFQSHVDVGNSSDVPIFIVGMPRSGSTLVEQILSMHPSIAPGGEVNWFDDARQSEKHLVQSTGRFSDDALRRIGDSYLVSTQNHI